jgi:hypothetical protein
VTGKGTEEFILATVNKRIRNRDYVFVGGRKYTISNQVPSEPIIPIPDNYLYLETSFIRHKAERIIGNKRWSSVF